ncbi:N-acetylmuramoyl-L-alanine amidase, partial [bacterium]
NVSNSAQEFLKDESFKHVDNQENSLPQEEIPDNLTQPFDGEADIKNASKKENIDLIVIDPGHGGKDPGAIGKDGTREKDINLSVAKKVADILNRKYKKNVILTRKSDKFIPLRKRAEIANKKNADLFVSIHANASANKKARGFEIYFLSERASDAEAERVAQFENAVLKYEEETTHDVNAILWSMAINEYINQSSEICYFIQKTAAKELNQQDRRVRQAGFVVLKGARMPSILVEMGYITNKKDLKMLKSRKFQQALAISVADGIISFEKYMNKNNSLVQYRR